MDAIFYTVQSINGDYALLRSEHGTELSVTMLYTPVKDVASVSLLFIVCLTEPTTKKGASGAISFPEAP